MKRICLCLMLLAAIVLTGCKKEPKQIIAETKPAIVTIYTFDEFGSPAGTGSGFFIDPNGTGITNYHVLKNAVKAVVRTLDGSEYEIDEVFASDDKWDILMFTIKHQEGQTFPYLLFANKDVEDGDKVINISAPMGLEQTVSEGIVSSLRTDSHGQVIQVTAPISPGSSGSPILNDDGKVIAVATFTHSRGQNLNFGVAIDDARLDKMTDNPFLKKNRQFNRRDNFVILNIPNEGDGDVILHALEFKKDATIAYVSYTNLNMSFESMLIWCELDKKDEGFLIEDKARGEKYYITSSTIGTEKDKGAPVPLASNYRFKVYFPAIKDTVQRIDITYGQNSRGWKWRNIDLDQFRGRVSYDLTEYQKLYAFVSMHQGDLVSASDLFEGILEDDPEDADALNAMGIISFAVGNLLDAEAYFDEAIEAHPNSTVGYLNRSQLFKNQKDYNRALADLDKAIGIDPAQPDNYFNRADIYAKLEKWEDAEKDLTKAIESDDYKNEALIYYRRAICYAWLKNR